VDSRPSALPSPQAPPLNAWGHNYRFGRQDLERAVFDHVMARASSGGRPAPCGGDAVRFVGSARAVFLDAAGREIEPDRVVVVWEER
jgi:hypothetical protein